MMRRCLICRQDTPLDDLRRLEMKTAICLHCWEYHTDQRPLRMPPALRREITRALEGTGTTDWWKR